MHVPPHFPLLLVFPSREHMYLVMTLRVGYTFLAVPPVGQCEDDIAYVPVFILYLLQDLQSDRKSVLKKHVIDV